MTEFESGYLQALKDVKRYCETTQMDRDTPDEGRAELELLIQVVDGLLGSKATAKQCAELLTAGG